MRGGAAARGDRPGRPWQAPPIKVARDTAVKARTSTTITLKQIVVNAPAELQQLAPLSDKALLGGCARLRPGSSIRWLRRTSKREIIRCSKRYLPREIYQRVMTDHRARQRITPTA